MKNKFTKLTKKIVYILPFFLLPFMMNGQWVFEITEPGDISGMYPMGIAQFGAQTPDTISGDIQMGDPALGCDALSNDLSGSIGMLDRGDCTFVEKAQNAQDAGAIALIVCNTSEQIINMPSSTGGGDITIQTILLQQSTCEAIKAALDEGAVSVQFYRNELEVIWGGVDDPNSTFDGGLNDWTTQIREGFENAAEEDVFVWLEGGDVTEGLVSNEDNIINSPTASNGAAGMNLDLNTTDGVNNPGQPPYPFYVAELISPVIDLSEVESPLALSFYQLYRNLNFVGGNDFKSALQLSVDGGVTWGPMIVLNEEVMSQGRVNNQLTIPLSSDILGAEEFRFKFVISMDFYYWVIDDVVLTELPATNLSATDVFNPVFSFATPEAHIYADTFAFGLNIRNRGLDQDVVEANVEVRNASTNELLHSDFLSVEDVQGGMDSFVIFDQSFSPDLPPGDYVINYRIDSPGSIDFDYSTNVKSFAFRVTETTYAKDNPELVTFTGSTRQLEASWYWGNAYYIAPQDNPEVEAYFDGSQHAFLLNEGEEFTDESALVYLLEYAPDGPEYDFDVINQDVNTVPDLHPAFTQLAVSVIDADKLNEAGAGNIFTLHYSDYLDPNTFASIEEPIALQQDKLYFVIVQIEQDPNVANLRIATSSGVEYSVINGLLWTQGRNWTGFIGNAVPIARMLTEVRGVSATDRFISENQFSVYPVPASSELFIDFELEQPTDMDIQLFDIQGRMMRSTSHTNVTSEVIPQDVTEYQTGNYIIRIVTENGVQTRQVLIVK
nr:T9SS type A sorting domain-containing protein [Saprospiraceae bacterium]